MLHIKACYLITYGSSTFIISTADLQVETKIELPATPSVNSERVNAEVEESFVEIGMFGFFDVLIYMYHYSSIIYKQHLVYMHAAIPKDERDHSTMQGTYN